MAHGHLYEGNVTVELDVAVNNEQLTKSGMWITARDGSVKGAFKGHEGIFDGTMFHASGIVSLESGEEFKGEADFVRDEEGGILDFNIAIQ